MTELNKMMGSKICRYCGNSTGTHCLANVPWYALSWACSGYRETPPETAKTVKRRRVNPLRSLVETL